MDYLLILCRLTLVVAWPPSQSHIAPGASLQAAFYKGATKQGCKVSDFAEIRPNYRRLFWGFSQCTTNATVVARSAANRSARK